MLEARWKTLKSSNLRKILKRKSRRNSRSYKKMRMTKRRQRGGSDEGVPFGTHQAPRGLGGIKVGMSDEGVPQVTAV